MEGNKEKLWKAGPEHQGLTHVAGNISKHRKNGGGFRTHGGTPKMDGLFSRNILLKWFEMDENWG